MGVRGLMSFINSRHEDYFIPVQLSGCDVIVGETPSQVIMTQVAFKPHVFMKYNGRV